MKKKKENMNKMIKSKSSPALLKKWKSVEIISDESILETTTDQIMPRPTFKMNHKKESYSDSELIIRRNTRNRRSITRTATMSGLALKADVIIDETEALSNTLFAFERVHMVTSDGVLVISNALDFMIERRINLTGASITEVKNRKRTGILLRAAEITMILKFRCRSERQQWCRVLKRQSVSPRSEHVVEFTPNKRRQIYFIDGPEELKEQTEAIQKRWDRALRPKEHKVADKIGTLVRSLLSCVICK